MLIRVTVAQVRVVANGPLPRVKMLQGFGVNRLIKRHRLLKSASKSEKFLCFASPPTPHTPELPAQVDSGARNSAQWTSGTPDCAAGLPPLPLISGKPRARHPDFLTLHRHHPTHVAMARRIDLFSKLLQNVPSFLETARLKQNVPVGIFWIWIVWHHRNVALHQLFRARMSPAAA